MKEYLKRIGTWMRRSYNQSEIWAVVVGNVSWSFVGLFEGMSGLKQFDNPWIPDGSRHTAPLRHARSASV